MTEAASGGRSSSRNSIDLTCHKSLLGWTSGTRRRRNRRACRRRPLDNSTINEHQEEQHGSILGTGKSDELGSQQHKKTVTFLTKKKNTAQSNVVDKDDHDTGANDDLDLVIHETLHRNDFTTDEFDSYWITTKEFETNRQIADITIQLMYTYYDEHEKRQYSQLRSQERIQSEQGGEGPAARPTYQHDQGDEQSSNDQQTTTVPESPLSISTVSSSSTLSTMSVTTNTTSYSCSSSLASSETISTFQKMQRYEQELVRMMTATTSPQLEDAVDEGNDGTVEVNAAGEEEIHKLESNIDDNNFYCFRGLRDTKELQRYQNQIRIIWDLIKNEQLYQKQLTKVGIQPDSTYIAFLYANYTLIDKRAARIRAMYDAKQAK